MNSIKVPKLTPYQWFKLLMVLAPLVRGIVRATGLSLVAVVRIVADLVFQIDAMFPTELDAGGLPIKQGGRKLAEFAEAISGAFATADESMAALQNRVGDVSAIATATVDLFNQWAILPKVSGAVKAS